MPTQLPFLTALALTTAVASSVVACGPVQQNPGSNTSLSANETSASAPVEEPTLVVGEADDEGWVTMFNGKDLSGWTPKFSGYELGENYRDTFRVEDGHLIVDYSNWERFDGEFGHLFFTGNPDSDNPQTEFSHYIMRVEYRFVGEQVQGGPGWAWRNNGIMYHGQPADTMGLDQDFPCCIEAQFNGGHAEGNRPNGNVCTPGTHIYKDGELTHAHVVNFNGPTHRGDEWVTYEIEVHGSERAIHRLNGEVVADYGPLVIDPNDSGSGGTAEAERRGTTVLGSGTISLQAETAPIEFRDIRIKMLEEDESE